jgi:hypothetical protein
VKRWLPRRVDKFETLMGVLGALFLAIAVGSVALSIYLGVTFTAPDENFRGGSGMTRVLKGIGILMFAALAVASFGVADSLLGHHLSRILRRRRQRRAARR